VPCGSSLGTVRLSGQSGGVKTEEDSDANLTGINMSLRTQVLEPRLDDGIVLSAILGKTASRLWAFE
jgi:hypothetical protein